MVYDLYKYVNTDFILQIHYDGFVVHPELWSNDFLTYDYIGSPWREADWFICPNGEMSRVGNSVGIRSKKLLEMPSRLGLEFTPNINGLFNEDTFLCVSVKEILEKNGCTFAPLSVAARFGKEMVIPENKGKKTFLFHKWWEENRNYPDFRKTFIQRWEIRCKDFIRAILRVFFPTYSEKHGSPARSSRPQHERIYTENLV